MSDETVKNLGFFVIPFCTLALGVLPAMFPAWVTSRVGRVSLGGCALALAIGGGYVSRHIEQSNAEDFASAHQSQTQQIGDLFSKGFDRLETFIRTTKSDPHAVSNRQLAQHTIDLASDMLALSTEWQRQLSQNEHAQQEYAAGNQSKSQAEQDVQFQKSGADYDALNEKYKAKYEPFVPLARLYRKQLEDRVPLGKRPPDDVAGARFPADYESSQRDAGFRDFSAGPDDVSAAAKYLIALANALSPGISKP